MSAEENKALVRRYFEAIDARRVPAVVDEFLGIDFVSHSPSPGLRRRAVSLSDNEDCWHGKLKQVKDLAVPPRPDAPAPSSGGLEDAGA